MCHTPASTDKKKGGFLARKAKKAETEKVLDQAEYEKKLRNKDAVSVDDILKLTRITDGSFEIFVFIVQILS